MPMNLFQGKECKIDTARYGRNDEVNTAVRYYYSEKNYWMNQDSYLRSDSYVIENYFKYGDSIPSL